jgi:pimeloyl-ACP methyl ester carboxylesterase
LQGHTDGFVRLNLGHDRLRLGYSSWGSGRPVLLLHGMGSWRRIWPRFELPGYRFFALDLPGFGESTLPRRRQDLPDYSAVVAAFWDEVGPAEPPLLAGHSFGAMVAVYTARERLRTAGLLLVSPAGFVEPYGVLTPTRFVALNRVLIWVTAMEVFGRQMAAALGLDPAAMDAATRRDLQLGWRRAREMARMGKFYTYPAMRADLTAAGVPHRILMGTRDPLFPVSRVHEALDDLAVEWLPDLGHVPMLQEPAGFRSAFRRALIALYPPRAAGESPENGTPT